MTAPDSQGKPRSRAQAARVKAKTRDGGTHREVKQEFRRLFPVVPENLVDGMQPALMEAMVQHASTGKAEPTSKKKSQLRFEKFNRFHDLGVQEADLSPPAQLVWYSLWRYENWGRARVSVARLMKTCNICERSVYNAITELKEAGLVEVIERGNSRSKCSVYRLFADAATARGAPVEESATTAHGAVTPAPRAVTPAPNDRPTEEEQKVTEEPSVLLLQNGRSGPTDVRLGDARSVLPTWQTNPDGGTTPHDPPPSALPESACRHHVARRVARLVQRGLRPPQIMGMIMAEAGDDELRKEWARDEVANLCGSAT